VVDLAIAANFVRELTEEQFAEQRGNGRRGMTEQRRNGPRRVAEQRPRVIRRAALTGSVNGSDPARASARSEPTRGRTRNETTGLRRALARFAQVRG
jgi:hypothetical protein